MDGIPSASLSSHHLAPPPHHYHHHHHNNHTTSAKLWHLLLSFKYSTMRALHGIVQTCRRPPILALLVILVVMVAVYGMHVYRVTQVYRGGLPSQTLSSHALYHTSLSQYIGSNNVRSLLHINCQLQCLLMQRDSELAGLQVKYIDGLPELEWSDEDGGLYADWANLYGGNLWELEDNRLGDLVAKLRAVAKIGVSLVWQREDYQQLSLSDINRIKRAFAAHGLTYNTIESLKLSRVQGKVIQVYIRFYLNSQYFEGTSNEPNFLSVQTEIKLYRDIHFLREWIGYHIAIGVDKFFIYHLPDDEGEGCVELPREEVEAQWLRIWKDYYGNIVYIPWRPQPSPYPNPLSLLLREPDPQHDYMYNYGKETNFTMFLPTNMMIFSKFGMKLTKSLIDGSLRTGFNSFQFRNKYFVARECTGSNYMLDNYYYYDHVGALEDSTFVFRTGQYRPFWGLWGGYIASKYTQKFVEKEWRVNAYSLTKQLLGVISREMKYPNLYFSYDYSAESRISMIARICDKKYFLSLDYACPRVRMECPSRMPNIV